MHEGLAALLALRFTRLRKATFSLSVNDYGIEFLTSDAFPFEEALRPTLFTRERLVEDILESVNLSELARRQFRDIARVAGLRAAGAAGGSQVHAPGPGQRLALYDVFLKYDPENLLLVQARREVLEQHFEQSRLAGAPWSAWSARPWSSFPSGGPRRWAFPSSSSASARASPNESLLERVERLKERWQREDARSA